MDIFRTDITSEHLRRRYDELEKRVGLAALISSGERAELQQIELNNLEGRALRDYLETVLGVNGGILDDVEEEDGDLTNEIRSLFGVVNHYELARVNPGELTLNRSVVTEHPNLFQPYLQLTYDSFKDERESYTKKFRAIDMVNNIAIKEPRAVTDEDKETILLAFERLVKINDSFGNKTKG